MNPYSIQYHPKQSSYQIKQKAKLLTKVQSMKELASLLKTSVANIKYLGKTRNYHQFYIPKPTGGKRLIQSPYKALKEFQERLNAYLQAAYHWKKTDSAYGCILTAIDDEIPRNIYTNALKHMGKQWVLNIDLKDFFHTISKKRIQEILQEKPFNFDKKIAKQIAVLVTFENRLPMGAPTSPALANFVCAPLDATLEAFARKEGWSYSRFVDDMTFSSKQPISKNQLQKIYQIVANQRFKINKKKVTIYNCKKEAPVITGLILRKKQPDIAPSFLANLKKDLKTLRVLTSTRLQQRQIFPAYSLAYFRKMLLGQINFIRFVRGEGNKMYLRLKKNCIETSVLFCVNQ